MGAQSRPKVQFADQLRGIACFSVLFSHYVLGSQLINGAYAGFPALNAPMFPHWLHRAASLSWFNWGSFGVSVFFIISGFVIPISVAAMAQRPMGRLGFVVSRFFRIYPTYWVGLLLTLAATEWSYRFNGLERSPKLLHVLSNMTLFRDWFQTPQLDGVAWTLELEVKFYLLMTVAWTWAIVSNGRLLFSGLTLCAVAVLGKRYSLPGLSSLSTNLHYLAYFGIGSSFYLCLFRNRAFIESLATSSILFGMFLASQRLIAGKLVPGLGWAYLLSFILFSALVLKHRRTPSFKLPIPRILSDLSFPVYAMHAAVGYVGIRVMVGAGISGLVAFVVQTLVTCLIAYVIRRRVEIPTQEFGKRLGQQVSQGKGLKGWMRFSNP